MNLTRSIQKVEKDLRANQKKMRAAKAADQLALRMECDDLYDKLAGLEAKNRAQNGWKNGVTSG